MSAISIPFVSQTFRNSKEYQYLQTLSQAVSVFANFQPPRVHHRGGNLSGHSCILLSHGTLLKECNNPDSITLACGGFAGFPHQSAAQKNCPEVMTMEPLLYFLLAAFYVLSEWRLSPHLFSAPSIQVKKWDEIHSRQSTNSTSWTPLKKHKLPITDYQPNTAISRFRISILLIVVSLSGAHFCFDILSATISAINHIAVAPLIALLTCPRETFSILNMVISTIIYYLAANLCFPFFRLMTHLAHYTPEVGGITTRSSRYSIQNISLSTELATTRIIRITQREPRSLISEIDSHGGVDDDAYRGRVWFEEGEEEEEEPFPSPWRTILAYTALVVIYHCSVEFLFEKLWALTQGSLGPRYNCFGLFLLSIVGNISEDTTAIIVALRGQLDLVTGVSIGLSIYVGHDPFMRFASASRNKVLEFRKTLARTDAVQRVYGLEIGILIAATLSKLSFRRFIRSVVHRARCRRFRCLIRRGTMQRYMHQVNYHETTVCNEAASNNSLQGSWFGWIGLI